MTLGYLKYQKQLYCYYVCWRISPIKKTKLSVIPLFKHLYINIQIINEVLIFWLEFGQYGCFSINKRLFIMNSEHDALNNSLDFIGLILILFTDLLKFHFLWLV